MKGTAMTIKETEARVSAIEQALAAQNSLLEKLVMRMDKKTADPQPPAKVGKPSRSARTSKRGNAATKTKAPFSPYAELVDEPERTEKYGGRDMVRFHFSEDKRPKAMSPENWFEILEHADALAEVLSDLGYEVS
jgi:hypothetical protein